MMNFWLKSKFFGNCNFTLTGQKYLNNDNLYSYIQPSRGIRTSVDASTWMLT